MTIRPARPPDFPVVADLLTRLGPERVGANELGDEMTGRVPGKLLRRWLAHEGDLVVATAFVVCYPSQPPGLFNGGVVVEPRARRRGIGRALAEGVEAFAREHAATELRTQIREDEPEGVAFARRRGFVVLRRSVRATLDLTAFDPGRFARLLERVEGSGVRLCKLCDLGVHDESLRRLYAINRVATVDDPASLDGTFPTFERWRGLIVDRAGFQPEGQLLALDGERFVGLSAVAVDAQSRTADTLLTGVDPQYRGRGIATALKVRALTLAREAGATRTETETDERNAAMIAVNRKLGYEPQPGYIVLGRVLARPG